MKLIHSSFIRSLSAIATGVLLIMYSDQLLNWLVITFGALFFISGAISLVVYYIHRKKAGNVAEESGVNATLPFPLVGVGSLLLGIILICMPHTFVTYLIYLFAAILILGAINQFINLAQMIKLRPLHWSFWILPIILFVVGCISVLDPGCIANFVSTIHTVPIGCFLILYGFTEIINSTQIHRMRKKASRDLCPISKENIEDAEIIEETPPTNK